MNEGDQRMLKLIEKNCESLSNKIQFSLFLTVDTQSQSLELSQCKIWKNVTKLSIISNLIGCHPYDFFLNNIRSFFNLRKLEIVDSLNLGTPISSKNDFRYFCSLSYLKELTCTMGETQFLNFAETVVLPTSLTKVELYCYGIKDTMEIKKITDSTTFYKTLSSLVYLESFTFELMTNLVLNLDENNYSFVLFETVIECLNDKLRELHLGHSIVLNYEKLPNYTLVPFICDKFSTLTSLSLNFKGMVLADDELYNMGPFLTHLRQLMIVESEPMPMLFDKMIFYKSPIQNIEWVFKSSTTEEQLAEMIKKMSFMTTLESLKLYAYSLKDKNGMISEELRKMGLECTELREIIFAWDQGLTPELEMMYKGMLRKAKHLNFGGVMFKEQDKIVKSYGRIHTIHM